MRIKGYYFGPRSLTRNELRLGRYLRDGEGHPAPAAPAPDAAPAASPAIKADADNFSDFEASLGDKPIDDLDDTGTPAEPAAEPSAKEPGGNPPEPSDKGAEPEQKISDAEAARQKAEAERDEARAQLEQLRKANEPATPPAKVEGQGAPNPDDYEFGEADAKYIAETARWHARQEFEAMRQQERITAEGNAAEQKWQASIKPELTADMPDFQAKVIDGATKGEWPCTPLMALAIKDSDAGPQVAYHLATNPAEAVRIANLHPLEQAREFGRLEGRYMTEKAKASPASAPAPKIASSAPPPPEARARGAGGQFSASPDTDDFAAFDKMADGVLAGQRRR